MRPLWNAYTATCLAGSSGVMNTYSYQPEFWSDISTNMLKIFFAHLSPSKMFSKHVIKNSETWITLDTNYKFCDGRSLDTFPLVFEFPLGCHFRAVFAMFLCKAIWFGTFLRWRKFQFKFWSGQVGHSAVRCTYPTTEKVNFNILRLKVSRDQKSTTPTSTRMTTRSTIENFEHLARLPTIISICPIRLILVQKATGHSGNDISWTVNSWSIRPIRWEDFTRWKDAQCGKSCTVRGRMIV